MRLLRGEALSGGLPRALFPRRFHHGGTRGRELGFPPFRGDDHEFESAWLGLWRRLSGLLLHEGVLAPDV